MATRWMVSLMGASVLWLGAASVLAEDQPSCMMKCVAANDACTATCPTGTEAGSSDCFANCQDAYERCSEGCEADAPADPTGTPSLP